jgi:hypothetical protein
MTSAGARPVLPNFYYRFDSGHPKRIMREVGGFFQRIALDLIAYLALRWIVHLRICKGSLSNLGRKKNLLI